MFAPYWIWVRPISNNDFALACVGVTGMLFLEISVKVAGDSGSNAGVVAVSVGCKESFLYASPLV